MSSLHTVFGLDVMCKISFLNTKTNLKKLQYGVTKCFKMHVGKTYIPEVCPDLVIDGWNIKQVENIETNTSQSEVSWRYNLQ